MTSAPVALPSIIEKSRTRVAFGAGSIRRIGALVAEEGGARVLLVTDPERRKGLALPFHGFIEKPLVSADLAEITERLDNPDILPWERQTLLKLVERRDGGWAPS